MDYLEIGLPARASLVNGLMPKSVHSARHRLIADAIAASRRANGLSQAQVARALGRHQPFIANIESGERRIDLVELLDIAAIIGLDVEDLVRRVRQLAG